MSNLTSANKIISGLWICPSNEPLSNIELLCIHSFIANGHDFHLYTYGSIPNVPKYEDIKICDANEILPADRIFTCQNSLAAFSDWFRWELMQKKGGWYVDMDMVCLRPFSFPEKIIFGRENDRYYQSNVIKFPPQHYVALELTKSCAHPNTIMPWDPKRHRYLKISRRLKFWQKEHQNLRWGESGGPVGFTRAVKYYAMEKYAKSQYVFSPIPWLSASSLINEDLHDMEVLPALLKNSHAIHFYNNVWVREGWGKNGVFATHSPFEILKQRYLPASQQNTDSTTN